MTTKTISDLHDVLKEILELLKQIESNQIDILENTKQIARNA